MVPMVLLKLIQYINEKKWDDVFETIHMFFVGSYTLYVVAVMQKVSVFYDSSVNTMKTNFTGMNRISISDLFIIIILWVSLFIAYVLYVGSCIYYGDVLVPVWVPFIDNEKELTTGAFYFVWIYQTGAAYYMFCTLAIWGPFNIVGSICIVKELEILTKIFEEFSLRRLRDLTFQVQVSSQDETLKKYYYKREFEADPTFEFYKIYGGPS
jgi:hypothetical protein